MRVTRAVITAAGERQRRLSLQTLIDTDGTPRTVLAILVREVRAAGIEDICVVVSPRAEAEYAAAAGEGQMRFIPQTDPRGYGDAVMRAREFVGGEAFLHLVGDHVWPARNGHSCAADVVRLAESESCTVSAVRETHESVISSFGVVAGPPVAGRPGHYRVETVVEKPTPTVAERRLIVPGLRSGHYLAFFGMHVLTPAVFTALDAALAVNPGASLSEALGALAAQEQCLALQLNADRYDLGTRFGLLNAQLALALAGPDRDEVLRMMVGLLAGERR